MRPMTVIATGTDPGLAPTARHPRLLCPAVLLALAVAAAAAPCPAAGEEPKAPTHSVVVGKATLNWYLDHGPPAVSTAGLIEQFRAATAGHLTSEELPEELPAARKPVRLGEEAEGYRMPSELISTMFFDPLRGQYCSESIAPTRATVAPAAKEGDD